MKKLDLEVMQKQVTELRVQGKYKEAIETAYQLLHYGSEYNDPKSILIAHLTNAISFYSIGDVEEALFSIEAYHEVCIQYGDESDWLKLNNVMFVIYEMKKDYLKAKDTLRNTIEIGKRMKSFDIVSNAYSNLSHIYLEEKNFKLALEMARLGVEMALLHSPKSIILELRVKLNVAKSYVELGDLDNSKRIIDEIINAPILDSYTREKSQCFDLLGAWYSKQGLYRDAYDACTTAKQLVEEKNDLYLLKAIQEERIRLCELMDNVQLGYVVQKEYIALLQEISNRELLLAAQKVEVKHSISLIEKKPRLDSLTGVYNRNYLENTVDEWLKQASTKKENIVCIVLDIDHFKSINDEFGHLFGDQAIKQVSKACLEVLQEGEIVGRFGGDEFIAILKGVSLEIGEQRARKMKELINNIKMKKDEKVVSIQASIGVADNLAGTITSFQDLFHNADMALYKAKNAGKNQVFINDGTLHI